MGLYVSTPAAATRLFVVKAADESVTSSTTLQDDNHLLFPIGANETWSCKFHVYAEGATAGDIGVALTFPTGATVVGGASGLALGVTTVEGDARQVAGAFTSGTLFVTLGLVGAGTQVPVEITASIVNGSTAGNVVLQWAQRASSGTATIVKAGSWLEADRH